MRQKSGEVVVISRSCFDVYQKSGRLHYWTTDKDGTLRPNLEYDKYGVADIFDVPCGHCINCRLDYAKKWSHRCLLEAKSWSENFFLTLTYDDEFLTPTFDNVTGELLGATLVPKDVTDFLKRLREKYRIEYDHTNIRFYMAGEYGDHTFRPHYHMIAFNLPIFDLKYYSKSPLGDCYYNSDTINSLWGKGHVVIGEVTAQSAAYTARYCQKKAGKEIDYAALGLHKEYTRMSRRPGIGLPYLQEHYESIYANDTIYLPDGKTCTPMRYFDDKAADLFGVDIESIKERRREVAAITTNFKVDEVSREYYSYLDDLEQECVKRSKILRRNL